LGAAYVPMYEKELVTMWKYIVKDAVIKVLLVSRAEILEKIKDFPAEIPTLKHIYLIEGTGENTMAALEKKGAAKTSAFPKAQILRSCGADLYLGHNRRAQRRLAVSRQSGGKTSKPAWPGFQT